MKPSESTLTLALCQKEREQEFWLPSLWGEGLGMRVFHPAIQQRPKIGMVFAVAKKYTTVKDMETIEFLMLYAAGERDFHNIDLSSASLACADLKGAKLIRANLRHANLRWADLRQTDLSWADLRGADLSWADLTSANLSHANLKGAKMPDGTMHE